MHLIRADNFNLQQIADSGQCFRMNKVVDGIYSVISCGKYLEIQQIKDMIMFGCSESEYNSLWVNYFDMKTNYSDIISGAVRDEFLSDAIAYGSGIRILRQELFETIISFIISQRKNIYAIKSCIEKLCERYGEPIKGFDITLHEVNAYAFPSVTTFLNLSEEELKDCGVGYRAKYIKDAAEWYSNWLSDKCSLSYDILISEISGVGAKVASCICLFGLHQLEFCPVDVWIKRIFDEHYGGQIPEWATSKYAGVYQQYCFYYKRKGWEPR